MASPVAKSDPFFSGWAGVSVQDHDGWKTPESSGRYTDEHVPHTDTMDRDLQNLAKAESGSTHAEEEKQHRR